MSLCLGIRTWRRFERGKGYKKGLDLMHLQGIWTPYIWKFFSHVMEYSSLRGNSTSIAEKDKALRSL